MGTAGAGPRPPASEYAASQGNVLGRMTALTLMTPVRRQWLWFLRLGFRLAPYSPLRDHITARRAGSGRPGRGASRRTADDPGAASSRS